MPEITYKRINSFSHKMRTRVQLSVKVELNAKKLLKQARSKWIKELAKQMIADSLLCRQTIVAEINELDDFVNEVAAKEAKKNKKRMEERRAKNVKKKKC